MAQHQMNNVSFSGNDGSLYDVMKLVHDDPKCDKICVSCTERIHPMLSTINGTKLDRNLAHLAYWKANSLFKWQLLHSPS